MKIRMPNLKIYKDKSGREWGYDADELEVWMKLRGLYNRWCKFYAGQTAVLIGDRVIIYKWDVEKFLEGKPVID